MTALPIPDAPEDIDAAWVTAALRAADALRAGEAVTHVEAAAFADERGIGGRVARLDLQYDRPSAAPATLIAKLPSAIELTRGGGRFLRLPEREVRFYLEVAPQLTLRTPRCYLASVDDEGDAFVLLLEDLGALPHGDDVEGTTLERAKIVVDSIAAMHAAWWDSPQLPSLGWMPGLLDGASMWQRMFATAWRDSRVWAEELLDPEAVALGESLTRRFERVLRPLGDSPPTLLHGDLRLDNLFFDGPRLAAVDWSNAARGPGPYDLAYFMAVAFTPERRREVEGDLLARYVAALAEGGVSGYPLESAHEDYRRAFVEPFARMFFLLVRGHADKGQQRPAEVLTKFVRHSAQAAIDLGVPELISS